MIRAGLDPVRRRASTSSQIGIIWICRLRSFRFSIAPEGNASRRDDLVFGINFTQSLTKLIQGQVVIVMTERVAGFTRNEFLRFGDLLRVGDINGDPVRGPV